MRQVIVDFAKFDMKERPTLILKNANCVPIGVLGYARGIDIDLSYNETSTIEFELPAFADGEAVPYYESVVGMQIVELVGVGQFTLVNPKETGDGVSTIKTCKGYSLEYEFAYKKLTIAEGTYNFYDLSDNSNTLMGMILEKMPSWSVGAVDDGLIGKYRTFEVSNENLYNFIKGTIQESYCCIFEFDTMQRKIYVRDVSKGAEVVPVFVSTGNLASQIEVEENTEDIVTRLDVNGAEGVNIRDVNPCGTNKIIDLSHFMTQKYFSQALIDKYFAWKSTVSSNRQPYYAASIEYSALVMRKVTETAKMTDLKGELANLENIQGVTIQAIAQGLKTQADLDQANANLTAKKREITTKENEIASIESEMNALMGQLKTIREVCSFEQYFTADEQRQMDKYIKDGEISESSFAVVEKDTYTDHGSGSPLTSKSVAFRDASITNVAVASGKEIYDVSGGRVTVGDLISATVISAIVEIKTDHSLVMTAYLSKGTHSGNAFDDACLSVTGSASGVTHDLAAASGGMSEGSQLEFTAGNAYLYFSFDVSEYQKRSVAWDLFKYGEEVLSKLAQPSYTFDVTSANFFTGEDFEVFRGQIGLGKKIYTELNDGLVLKPICIGVRLQYENPESLELRFSDSYVSGDSTFRLVDLLNQSVSMGKNLEVSKYIYSSFEDSGANNGIKEFMTSALDVAKNAIMTSGEQAISWDASGLRLRRYANDSKTAFEPEQIWMINNSIVMTADGWQTAQMAIGKFHDDNLGDCWGIVAPRIVGTLLAGKELVIESSKKEGGVSVFRVDSEGVRLHNGDLSVTGGNRHIALNPSLGIVIGKYPVYSKDGSGKYTLDEDNANFWADTEGNLHYRGTLHAASGDFTGNIKATSLTIISGSSNQSIDDYVANHDSVSGAQRDARDAKDGLTLLEKRVNEAEFKVTPEVIAATVREEIEFGGRNLYKGTKDFSGSDWYNKTGWTEDGTYNGCTAMKHSEAWMGLCQDCAAEVGEYTLSAWAKCSVASTVNAYFVPGSTSSGSATVSQEYVTIPDVGTQWKRISATFNVTAAGNLRARFELTTSSKTLWICGLKLEKGNVATDWSPAPEDAEGEIGALKNRVSEAETKITPTAIVSTVTSSESYQSLSSTASTAKNTAETAKTNAATAQSTANGAKNKADANESSITALTKRVNEAELKITPDAIVSTVTSSESYKSLSNTADTAKNNAATAQKAANDAQSTANTAKTNASNAQSAADKAQNAANAAQSTANTNKSDITALTTRVSQAEMKITPEAITATVKEKIELGGRNYILNSRETFEAQGAETELATVRIGDTASKETALSLFGETVTVSFDWEHTVTAGTATLMFNYKFNGVKAFTADVAATGHYENTFQLEAIDTPPDWANANILYVYGTFTGTIKIRNLKLEKGNKATDWSPAPEDAADSVYVDSSYSKVEINKDRVRIVSTQMEVAVPSEGGEDDVMRVDKDGVHAEVVEADTVLSDSVVSTQGAASYTPADAGALAEILEELSGRYLTGVLSIDCKNVSSGSFEVQNVHGPGRIRLLNGTMNGLTIANCDCYVYCYSATFSTAGTGAVVDNSERVYFSTCTFNAGVGIQLGSVWRARARMHACTGTCTVLAKLTLCSELDLSGSKPTGTLNLEKGSQVYNATSDPNFTAPSSGSVPTTQVATVSLSPTSTSTSGHSGLGSKLYQGRYSSSQSFRKGVMLFTLPSDLTSAANIESATLTIKRIAGVGGGGSVVAQIRCYNQTGTLYASKSVQNGQTVSIDVTSAVKAMKTSGYTGLMLYNPATSTVGDKTYTTGYARFAGKGESGAPVLKITYKK